MEINEKILDINISNIIHNFIPSKYNDLSETERYNLILELSNVVACSLGVKIDLNKILFVDNKEFERGKAFFDFNNDTILLNKNLLNTTVNDIDIISALDNITHETIHYCQKHYGLFLNHLETPLIFPYDLLQPHEIEAYSLTDDFLEKYKKYFTENLSKLVNIIKDIKTNLKNECMNNLQKRGYSTDEISIENQINTILPFYKNINIVNSINYDVIGFKIKKWNNFITAGKINDIFCGIISQKNNNKLYFTITNDICYINDICIEDENKNLSSMSQKDKESSIRLLQKIIEAGNEIELFNCKDIIINPISIVDNKKEYDLFIHNFRKYKDKKIEGFTIISKQQIINAMLNNEER